MTCEVRDLSVYFSGGEPLAGKIPASGVNYFLINAHGHKRAICERTIRSTVGV